MEVPPLGPLLEVDCQMVEGVVEVWWWWAEPHQCRLAAMLLSARPLQVGCGCSLASPVLVLPGHIVVHVLCTHRIRLCSAQVPCDGHLHTGLADVRKAGHDHVHGDVLVFGWRSSHGAGGVWDPGTPVKLET